MNPSTDMLRFDGRVAIVTGAGRGIGRAHALLLAARGARVVVNDLGGSMTGSGASPGPAADVVSEIVAAGGEAVASTDTVSTPDGGRAIVAAALEAWGRVDIVVNNAGVLDAEPFEAADEATIDAALTTHLRGAFHVLRPAWPVMREQRYGRVVNTSSGAVFGSPAGLAYQAAKAGLIGLTRGLAVAGGDAGIKVNGLMPTAYTRMTDTIPDDRFREFLETRFTPERVAAAAALLAHERCPVTGELFATGGGRIARVFLGVTQGYVSDEITPEDVAAHFDEIMATGGFTVPADRMAEFAGYLGRVGFDPAALASTRLVDGDREPETE
ncbi:MAG: putative short-chain dehydrogenase/reductase [Acidimicrobiia bacterium]